ncbi:fimbrial protein [Enterobacter bugandensis]|uniref:fimbrial protein n=1 Tax=Enterobacter TaxID=547 RepID=UPI0020A20062|nr:MULTISPECIES: fimbrial protein [Enterobacter]MCP1116405.1 type 1 fimbrial protein [Enterobacter bugandensis]MDO2434284.1 fimbrial protein [Enterobacter bugandensis]MDO2447373.1 fimbrial protein [Enterobacter bugandensis]
MNEDEDMRGMWLCTGLVLLQALVILVLFLVLNTARADVTFQGNLLDRPCRVDPATGTQDVVFLETSQKTFNTYPGRGYTEDFQIRLINCYAMTIGKIVQLTFLGAEEAKLPGYLAVSGINAGNLGIGLIDTDGSRMLKLNHIHNNGTGDQVTGTELTLKFGAFVQSTPDAMAGRRVVAGNYSATATFELNYH